MEERAIWGLVLFSFGVYFWRVGYRGGAPVILALSALLTLCCTKTFSRFIGVNLRLFFIQSHALGWNFSSPGRPYLRPCGIFIGDIEGARSVIFALENACGCVYTAALFFHCVKNLTHNLSKPNKASSRL